MVGSGQIIWAFLVAALAHFLAFAPLLVACISSVGCHCFFLASEHMILALDLYCIFRQCLSKDALSHPSIHVPHERKPRP